MRERTFVTRHEATWEELETLLQQADRRGLRTLQPPQLRRLALLYRATTGDLAAAQSRDYTLDLRTYLNRLTARAHSYVYVESASGGFSRIVRMFTETFPQEFRRSGRIIAVMAIIAALPAIVTYVVTMQRPASIYAIMDNSEIPDIQKSLHDSNFAHEAASSPALSSEIITNNIKVSMIAFAGGLTLGLLTLYIEIQNGIMVGGLGALFTQKGFGPDFWATIAPHGVIELTAIVVSGAAGLLIAQSILAPGRLKRADSIRTGARRAGVLMIGVIGMLIVAGTIEGFYTPRRTPIAARATVGVTTAMGLLAYFSLAGRGGFRSMRRRRNGATFDEPILVKRAS